MNGPENDKQKLADALERMTGSAPQQQNPVNPSADASSLPLRPASAPGIARVRPAFPTISTSISEPAAPDPSPPVDDDLVAMTAPTPQELLSTHRSAANRSHLKSEHQSLRTRRTIVPILLTLGVMLPLLGGLWFCTGEDSPFRALSVFVPISMIILGSIFLVVALLNVAYLAQAMK